MRTSTRSPARRVTATVAGVSAVAASMSGSLLALAPSAYAAPAPGQDVLNDWGQTVNDVDNEVAKVVDTDPRVVAAIARYSRAVDAYWSLKQVQQTVHAARRTALATKAKKDDRRTKRAVRSIDARVLKAAREVVFSQLRHGEDRGRRRSGGACDALRARPAHRRAAHTDGAGRRVGVRAGGAHLEPHRRRDVVPRLPRLGAGRHDDRAGVHGHDRHERRGLRLHRDRPERGRLVRSVQRGRRDAERRAALGAHERGRLRGRRLGDARVGRVELGHRLPRLPQRHPRREPDHHGPHRHRADQRAGVQLHGRRGERCARLGGLVRGELHAGRDCRRAPRRTWPPWPATRRSC